jgi:hypothetical protein
VTCWQVFALVCTLPGVLLKKFLSGINSVAQAERAGEHIGLAVEGDGDRGFSDVVIGFSVGGFTDPVNFAHSILSPTKSAY